MKKLILSIVSLLAVGGGNLCAQTTEMPSATLMHEGTSTIFYGRDALRSAYDASVSGDKIVLSSGEFYDIYQQLRKNVSIYGVGMEADESTSTARTAINGGLTINPNNDEKIDGLHIEGIHIDNGIVLNHNANAADPVIRNLVIARCRFNGISFNASTENTKIRQCVNIGGVSGNTNYTTSNLVVKNTYLGGQATGFPMTAENMSTVLFDHCISNFSFYGNSSGASKPQGPYRWTNCVIRQNVADGASLSNCILFYYSGCPSTLTMENCVFMYDKAMKTIFEDEVDNMNYDASRTYKLISDYETAGSDGTEIGLQGGYGYEKTSPLPRITSSSVASTVGDDGLLHVSITAEAQPVVE